MKPLCENSGMAQAKAAEEGVKKKKNWKNKGIINI